MSDASACNVMITLSTADAEVVKTSPSHLAWLGRTRDGVVGHSCQEWAHPDFWELNWSMLQKALHTGRTVAWQRRVLRPDGTSALGQISVKPVVSSRGRQLAFCTNRIVSLDGPGVDRERLIKALEAADYVRDMVRSLAQMTADNGLVDLTQSLESVVGEAAAIAAEYARLSDPGGLH